MLRDRFRKILGWVPVYAREGTQNVRIPLVGFTIK